jgi:hypothetical protein
MASLFLGWDGAVEVEKFLDEGIGGEVADLVRGADLLDFALVDKDDSISDFEGFVLIVGDEEAGQMGSVVEAAQPVAQFFSDFGIERTEGFVEQEDFRFDCQSAGEGNTLPLTSGELARKALRKLGELNGLEELLDAGADLRFGGTLALFAHAETKGNVFKDAQMLEERVMLKDESGLALVGALGSDIAVAKKDASLVRKLESGDNAQQCGLAGTTWAKQGNELSALDGEIHVMECGEPRELFRDVFDMDAHCIILLFRLPP